MTNPALIIAFWRETGPQRWFVRDAELDRDIVDRFSDLHQSASTGALAHWEESAEGALALILLTDQFSRHLFRNSAHAFATDEMARNVADRAIARSFDQAIPPDLRMFFYLPFEHHEDAAAQARAVALFEDLVAAGGAQTGLDYAHLHADLIARFGRFPHRNAVMGRIPTPEEEIFLAEGGFAG